MEHIIILSHVTVKAALFIFSPLKKGIESFGCSLFGSVGSVCPNTLGSLMITCPRPCQGIQFLRMPSLEGGRIEWERMGVTEKDGANAALSVPRAADKSNYPPWGDMHPSRFFEVNTRPRSGLISQSEAGGFHYYKTAQIYQI